MKRPRAPIACYRCHHKKVRCDGGQPFCTRCQNTGSVCSYPSSRRSRNTQSNLVDPYIDHLSQLEHYIRQIESEMNEYRNMLIMTISNDSNDNNSNENDQSSFPQKDYLKKQLQKTEQEVQESRSILAQLRLRGEQRIARIKRNQAKESKQQKGSSSSTATNNTKVTKNNNINNNNNNKHIKNGHPSNNKAAASSSIINKKMNSSTMKSNDLINYNDLFLSTSHIHSVNESAHLYHASTSLSTSSHDNTTINSTHPTLSMNPLINLNQQQQEQQLSNNNGNNNNSDNMNNNNKNNDNIINHSSVSTNPQLYYSSLNMMDFPWTTPINYNHHDHELEKNKKLIKDSSHSLHHHQQPLDHQIDELNIKENEHYSSSTVATIEEAARLAQLHQLLQNNSSTPSSSSSSTHPYMMNQQN